MSKQFLVIYPGCRDCDIKLTEQIWKYYKPNLANQIDVIFLNLHRKDLPFPDSITRARRAIQKAEFDLRGETWFKRHTIAKEYRQFLGNGGNV